MSPADASVRPATRVDAVAIAALQRELWRTAYAPLLPPGALDQMLAVDAEARWTDAVVSPPSTGHRVLVATEAGTVVGFAAVGPAEDEDLDPTVAELLTLVVDGGVRRRGHGSRLLTATMDEVRQDGLVRAVTWLFDADGATQAFLEAAGWALDGARRELDMGQPVPQLRLHTDLR